MKRKLTLAAVAGAAVLALAVQAPAAASTTADATAAPAYDVSDAYVAGISSGGYMATQLQVAYSGTFKGAAIFAAGPYYCAKGSVTTGATTCASGYGSRDVPGLEATTQRWSDQGLIDPVSNLSGTKTYVFHGTQDTTVGAAVVDDLVSYYQHFGVAVTYDKTTAAGHGWISPRGPNPCGSSYTPYVNTCNTDPEGTFLKLLLGSVNPPATGALTGTTTTVNQNAYAPGGSAAAISMDANGYLYAPKACAAGETCRVVVALHGCQQGHSVVGNAFVDDANLNQYADTNHLLVLYPQATRSSSWSTNPQGCWDWWGYTGSDYAQRSGAQMRTIKAMVDGLG